MLSETTRNNLPEEPSKLSMQPSRIPNNPITSTPQQNNGADMSAINTHTVTKKRTRQQTVTVENAFPCKDLENIFSRIQLSPSSENQVMELQRQVQMFFIQKEREWENKLAENKPPPDNEELALCKIKLKSAQSVISRMEDFNKLLKSKSQLLARLNNPNSLFNGQTSADDAGTPRNGYPLSPGQVDDLTRERNSLREDIATLESNYADLFKRYEKMRENCVLLKNSEEELKNTLVEEAAKYERLLGKFKELRDTADAQLNQANLEIQRIIKQHEENTLGLRCRLKMNETQIQTLNLTIQGKDTQISELNKMVEELMEKNGIAGDGEDPEDGASMIFTPGYE
ncbi:hypothetical protein ACQ4LE_005032 [Meloidogyne hapla]|uniref:TACC_C domain-containing protein n=1 Tax=Meloidogyne hapla TaxID=6305 RepID=A0A1I8B521_MELHA